MIKLDGIEKVYRTTEIETIALNKINISVEKGEFVSIMGPSGSGKSTMLNIMGLIDIPTNGGVFIDDLRTESLEEKDLASIRNRLRSITAR